MITPFSTLYSNSKLLKGIKSVKEADNITTSSKYTTNICTLNFGQNFICIMTKIAKIFYF